MKQCILIPDSFKGTLSAEEFCQLGREVLQRHMSACRVLTIPVADGGEGTVDCFVHALQATRRRITVTGPWGEAVQAEYAVHGDTAFVEMAQAAGLPMVGERKDPSLTTTFGVGEIIRHAVTSGCREIVLGLGGSCTNDAGCGAAAALGVRFFDEKGYHFTPAGATLDKVVSYDVSAAQELLRGCRITAMCDIDNPMYGPQGAAVVFGPQKGADETMVAQLDENLRHLAGVMQRQSRRNVAELPGAGAAGAFGAGVVAFLGGELRSGIETVLDSVKFDELLEDTDLVFTGEGQLDNQSLRGKVVIGVARRAAAKNVPVVAVVGAVGDGAEKAYEMGVSAVFSINRRAEDFALSRHKTKENFTATMDSILRLLAVKEKKEEQA